jgi:hypothetical protein
MNIVIKEQLQKQEITMLIKKKQEQRNQRYGEYAKDL